MCYLFCITGFLDRPVLQTRKREQTRKHKHANVKHNKGSSLSNAKSSDQICQSPSSGASQLSHLAPTGPSSLAIFTNNISRTNRPRSGLECERLSAKSASNSQSSIKPARCRPSCRILACDASSSPPQARKPASLTALGKFGFLPFRNCRITISVAVAYRRSDHES